MKDRTHSYKGQTGSSRNRNFYISVVTISFFIFVIILMLTVSTIYITSKQTYADTLLTKAEYQMSQTTEKIDSYGTQAVYLRNSADVVRLLSPNVLLRKEQLVLETAIADDIWDSIGQMDIFVGAALQNMDGTFYLQNTKLDDFSTQVEQLVSVDTMDFSDRKFIVTHCKYNKEPIIVITSPVMDLKQNTLGYIHLLLNHQVYSMPETKNGYEQYLFSADNGQLVYCGNSHTYEVCERLSAQLFTKIQTAEKTGKHLISYRNAQEIPMLGAFCINNTYPLLLLTTVEKGEMSRAVFPFTIFQSVSALILLCVLAFVVYILFQRTTKPVTDMIEQCSRLAEGQDDVDIEAGEDVELGKLAKAFNGYRKKLEEVAFSDSLLSVGTRSKSLRDMQTFIISDQIKQFTIFLIDIKEFGKYNTVFSLAVGDQILKEVANRLTQIFCQNVYRINGDVFLGLRLEETDIQTIATLIHKMIKERMTIGQAEFEIDCRIGICTYPEHGQSATVLLEKAQSSLSQAKLQPDIDTVLYNDEMVATQRKEEEILSLLRRKINDHTLEVWYQPIYHIEVGKYISAEALLRLKGDDEIYISPFEAILIAEKNNIVDLVGDYVLEATCLLWKRLQEIHSDIEYIQVNLSVQQLAQKNYAEKALSLIRQSGVAPSHIGMEVTETMVIQSFASAVETLNQLRDSGIRIAMDDFGSGYSGINYLSKLPIDILKLDRELVLQVEDSEEQYEFVKTVVQLAKVKHMKAVAEGVETKEILDKITDCGADCIQGFYFSRPLNQDKFLAFIEKEYKGDSK
ncbi:MAG: sensor domain-containing phosphodiesterase [Lachnospiraceae bacterium]